MSCRDIRRLIEERVGDAAPHPRQAELDAHLPHCEECSRFLAESQALRALLHPAPRYELGAEFDASLRERLLQTDPVSPLRAGWERVKLTPIWQWRRPVYASAMAGVLALALVVLPQWRQSSPPRPAAELPVQEYVEVYRDLSQVSGLRIDPTQQPPDYDVLEASLVANIGEDYLR